MDDKSPNFPDGGASDLIQHNVDYITDLMSIAKEMNIGWAWWNIAGSDPKGGSSGVIFHRSPPYAGPDPWVFEPLLDALRPWLDGPRA